MPNTQKILTKRVQTADNWVNLAELFGITLVEDKLYSIQIIGSAKISYNSDPTEGYFTRNDAKPFTYEYKSGDSLFINTNDALVTIAE